MFCINDKGRSDRCRAADWRHDVDIPLMLLVRLRFSFLFFRCDFLIEVLLFSFHEGNLGLLKKSETQVKFKFWAMLETVALAPLTNDQSCKSISNKTNNQTYLLGDRMVHFIMLNHHYIYLLYRLLLVMHSRCILLFCYWFSWGGDDFIYFIYSNAYYFMSW